MKTAVDKVKKGMGPSVNRRFAVMCALPFDADFGSASIWHLSEPLPDNESGAGPKWGRRRQNRRPPQAICAGHLSMEVSARLRAVSVCHRQFDGHRGAQISGRGKHEQA